MNLYFRFAWLLLKTFWKLQFSSHRNAPLDTVRLKLRVWPTDIDLNRHINNGRYLTLMDLGRFQMLGDMGALWEIYKRRWFPVVGSAAITFKRPLNPFQKYEIATRIVGWDDKWFYIEQKFERDGTVYTVGIVRVLFKKARELIRPHQVIELREKGVTSPELPGWTQHLRDIDNELYESAIKKFIASAKD